LCGVKWKRAIGSKLVSYGLTEYYRALDNTTTLIDEYNGLYGNNEQDVLFYT